RSAGTLVETRKPSHQDTLRDIPCSGTGDACPFCAATVHPEMITNLKPVPRAAGLIGMLNSQSTCRTPTVSHVLSRLRIAAAPKRYSSRHRPRAIAAQFERC